MSLKSSDRFEKATNLEISQVPDGYVVYQTERDHVHYLNNVAAVIFELCESENTVEDIGAILQSAYELDSVPEDELQASMERLVEEGLIVSCSK
ncbi:MAG: PqqD family protein [Mesorhizobium sp.]